jgi:hypothetical protein
MLQKMKGDPRVERVEKGLGGWSVYLYEPNSGKGGWSSSNGSHHFSQDTLTEVYSEYLRIKPCKCEGCEACKGLDTNFEPGSLGERFPRQMTKLMKDANAQERLYEKAKQLGPMYVAIFDVVSDWAGYNLTDTGFAEALRMYEFPAPGDPEYTEGMYAHSSISGAMDFPYFAYIPSAVEFLHENKEVPSTADYRWSSYEEFQRDLDLVSRKLGLW